MSQRSSRSSTQQPATSSDEPHLGDQIADLISKKQQHQHDDDNNQQHGELSPLPEGWVEKKDNRTGKTYYYNRATKATTWKRPESHNKRASSTPTPSETPGDGAGSDASVSPPSATPRGADDGASPSPAKKELQEVAPTSAFVSMSITDVLLDSSSSSLSAASKKASASVPVRVSLLGPRLLIKSSTNAAVGFVDLASDVEAKMRSRVEVMMEEETLAIVVDEPVEEEQQQQSAASLSQAGSSEELQQQQDDQQQQQHAESKPTRVTRKLVLIRFIPSSSLSQWVDRLRTASTYSTADGSSSSSSNESGTNLMKLEIAAALSGLLRRVPPSDDNAASLFPFLNSAWIHAASSAFDASFRQHVDAYHAEAAAMVQSQAQRAQHLQAALEQEQEEHRRDEINWRAARDAANMQQSTMHQELMALQQQMQHPGDEDTAAGGSTRAASSSSPHTGGGSRSASAEDLMSRLTAQYTSEMVSFADAAQELQRKFQVEARKMCNIIAQKVHQDELLMQSAPALGASAEEHIRHRRTLEEAFKSLQTMHSETAAELEVARKRTFELKSDLGAAQESARHSIESERDRSQAALRNVQTEASNHMKRLAANVDTLRQDHAEELDKLRCAHEEAMAMLGKKLQISELKMLRAVEETEKTKFQLTHKSLEDQSKIAELKRQKAALELAVSELKKALMERDSSMAESTEAAVRAVDRKSAAEIARFKRLMIDRTLAGGGSISPGGTPHSQSQVLLGSPMSSGGGGGGGTGNTPRSAHNIGVGDTSAGHELYNSFRVGGSVTAGAHTQKAMRETSEAVMMLSPRSNNNSPSNMGVGGGDDVSVVMSGSASGSTSVPRLNFAQAVRTPRDALSSVSARGAPTGGTPRSAHHYAGSSVSARQQQQQQGGGFLDNPYAQSAPVPESETFRKLADISARLKDGLVALGSGSADEARRRTF